LFFFSNLTFVEILAGVKNRQKIANNYFEAVKLPPDLCTLGTLSAIGEELETKCLETVTEFKREGREERDRRENEGLGDR
jgi:hypothetical protein